jgi:hypothetical protein
MFNLFKKKEVAEAIKNLTAALAEEVSAKEYAETEVKISEKAVGGKVELIDGDGNLAPVPDGDMKVSGDDNVYTVKDGQISAINGEVPSEEAPKEEPPVEAAEDAPAEEAPADETKPNEEIDALKADVEALKAAIAEMQNMIASFASKDEVASFNSQLENLNQTLKAVAKMPVEFSKTNNNTVVKESDKQSQKKLKELFSFKK